MATSADGGDTTSPSPLDLLKKFYSLQEERVDAYRFLESGFSAYLEGAPNYHFELYRSLVDEITQSFKAVSEAVISIQHQFRDVHGMAHIADCISKVQLEEKEKLEHTVQLQLSRQGATDNPEDACQGAMVSELKEKIQQIVQKINSHMEDLKYESEDLYSSEGAER